MGGGDDRRLLAVRSSKPAGVLVRPQASILGAVHGEGVGQVVRLVRGGGARRVRRRPANAHGRAVRGALLAARDTQVGRERRHASDRLSRELAVRHLAEDLVLAQTRLLDDDAVLQREPQTRGLRQGRSTQSSHLLHPRRS